MHKPIKAEMNGVVSFVQIIACKTAEDAELAAEQFNPDIATSEYNTAAIDVKAKGKSIVVTAPTESICSEIVGWMKSELSAL